LIDKTSSIYLYVKLKALASWIFLSFTSFSNIPASPAYGVYISQLIRYARASSNYSDFLKRHLHLRNRPYAGEAGILLHMFGKFMILKLKSSGLS
jgi:hypothetical protein